MEATIWRRMVAAGWSPGCWRAESSVGGPARATLERQKPSATAARSARARRAGKARREGVEVIVRLAPGRGLVNKVTAAADPTPGASQRTDPEPPPARRPETPPDLIMSTSLLAFLTLLEERTRPLLPAGSAWRFQRLVDFRAREAVLQLWEDPGSALPAVLTGQVDLRETRPGEGPPSFTGALRTAAGGNDLRPFAFPAGTESEVERQAKIIAEMWRGVIGGKEGECCFSPFIRQQPLRVAGCGINSEKW